MRPQLNIIMFSMSRNADWKRGVNRNYHIVHNLLKDERVNKIISVDFLPFTWKRAAKVFALDQVWHDAQGEVVYGDLTSRCWRITSKHFVYSTIDSLLRRERITQELNRIIDEQGMRDNLVVWSYNPLYIGQLGHFGKAVYVFDAVDNWAAHASYADRRDVILHNYFQIEQTADIIYTVADELRSLFHNREHVHWIPNAVDPEHFMGVNHVSPKVVALHKPIIGFLGILQDRIDVDCIRRVAQDHPQATIVLAGPVWKGFPQNELERFPNIRFIGPIPYAEIPEVYRGFDVGIIPYKQNEFIRSTNSMKFYEYIAAGLPVVSTPCPGIERFGNAIYRAETPKQFSHAVGRALLEHTPERAQAHREFLVGNTWHDRIEDMLRLIYQQL